MQSCIQLHIGDGPLISVGSIHSQNEDIAERGYFNAAQYLLLVRLGHKSTSLNLTS